MMPLVGHLRAMRLDIFLLSLPARDNNSKYSPWSNFEERGVVAIWREVSKSRLKLSGTFVDSVARWHELIHSKLKIPF